MTMSVRTRTALLFSVFASTVFVGIFPSSQVSAGAERELLGPTEVTSGDRVTYITDGDCDDRRLDTEFLYKTGDATLKRTLPLALTVVEAGSGPRKIGFEVPSVQQESTVSLRVSCLSNSIKTTYATTVRINEPAAPAPLNEVRAALDFDAKEIKVGSKAVGTGDRPCIGGTITSDTMFVRTGRGKWELDPTYDVEIVNDVPVMRIKDVGRPVFDGVATDSAEVGAVIVCTTATELIEYSGRITVIDIVKPSATSSTIPIESAPAESDERRAISVAPSHVRVGGSVTFANTKSSQCSEFIVTVGAAGIQDSDNSKLAFEPTVGSIQGDILKSSNTGDWGLRLTFSKDFARPTETRNVTLTFACMRSTDKIIFRYQPAAFTVYGESVSIPTTALTTTTVGSTAETSSGASSNNGSSQAGSTGSGLVIPNGQSIDAAGNQILPRAYLDGDTQQLIELSTGNVIGEYDPISGQFIDPATGEVTGIVDPATGELIDAATGIQIGQSTRPEGSTDGLSALGLGDDAGTTSSDDGGSNILVIVLAAAVGALLVAVVALAISRRKKPNLPPPPAV